MTRTKARVPKARKYHYNFYFKRGDYFAVSRSLADKFRKWFSGSGMFLHTGAFDVGFVCTSVDARKIRSYVERNCPSAKVTRSEP